MSEVLWRNQRDCRPFWRYPPLMEGAGALATNSPPLSAPGLFSSEPSLSGPLAPTPMVIARPRWRRWLPPLGCLLLAIVALPIDIPCSWFFATARIPPAVGETIRNFETFGHAAGVILIAVGVLVLDHTARLSVGWLLLGSLGAGGLADVFKLVISRTRPRQYQVFPTTVWETFGEWWPLKHSSDIQSIPSAHTATAVGLALMLSALYPRGRWYFIGLAALVGLQRVQILAHYPSDVFTGAALGWLCGDFVTRLGRWYQARQGDEPRLAYPDRW